MTETQRRIEKRREDFNSHPHEEDDRSLMKIPIGQKHFNSHPHEEDDNLGLIGFTFFRYFNSHPHEEDDENQEFES